MNNTMTIIGLLTNPVVLDALAKAAESMSFDDFEEMVHAINIEVFSASSLIKLISDQKLSFETEARQLERELGPGNPKGVEDIKKANRLAPIVERWGDGSALKDSWNEARKKLYKARVNRRVEDYERIMAKVKAEEDKNGTTVARKALEDKIQAVRNKKSELHLKADEYEDLATRYEKRCKFGQCEKHCRYEYKSDNDPLDKLWTCPVSEEYFESYRCYSDQVQSCDYELDDLLNTLRVYDRERSSLIDRFKMEESGN